MLRQGLRILLETTPGFCVVGEAGNGVEALKLVERLKPQILVLDLAMPALNGLEVLRSIGRRFPETRVIVLSMHTNESYVAEALKLGAAGYVLKCSTAADLVTAVRKVSAGERYFSSGLSEEAIKRYLEKTRLMPQNQPETLTAREREVVQLVAEGKGNKEVATALGISVKTAETHRSNLMRKLNLHSAGELVRFAIRNNMVEP